MIECEVDEEISYLGTKNTQLKSFISIHKNPNGNSPDKNNKKSENREGRKHSNFRDSSNKLSSLNEHSNFNIPLLTSQDYSKQIYISSQHK